MAFACTQPADASAARSGAARAPSAAIVLEVRSRACELSRAKGVLASPDHAGSFHARAEVL